MVTGTECLTVIIPVFNEEKTIKVVMENVKKQKIVGQIIIVDDGSTDNSPEIIRNLKSNTDLVKIYHENNQGKGASINSAKKYISKPFVIIQDADLEYNPDEYNKMLSPIIDGKADVVYGSRFQTGEYRRVLYFWHYIANKLLTLSSNIFTNLNLSDMETCYKAMKSSLLIKLKLQEKRFGFEPEITAKLAAQNSIFYEVSISYSGRTYVDGKKIKLKDAFRAIYCIIKYNIIS
jgi:glycosyltransferase involved in cell wall biosynthesis